MLDEKPQKVARYCKDLLSSKCWMMGSSTRCKRGNVERDVQKCGVFHIVENLVDAQRRFDSRQYILCFET